LGPSILLTASVIWGGWGFKVGGKNGLLKRWVKIADLRGKTWRM
jgi:hypothetical protein